MNHISIAKIARSRGLQLSDLAHAIDMSIPSIKQLEQNPPQKWNTWVKWGEKMLQWIPLLGSAFPDLFHSKAFVSCPHEIIYSLRTEFINQVQTQIISQSEISLSSASLIEKYSIAAQNHLNLGNWELAEESYRRATHNMSLTNPLWSLYRLEIAQIYVNKGHLNSAENLIDETLLVRQKVLEISGETIDQEMEAMAYATRGWSLFLRGESKEAKQSFEKGLVVARELNDNNLLNRCSHMGTRNMIEPYIFSNYFSDFVIEKLPPKELVRDANRLLEYSLGLDTKGSLREGYGLWYKGLINLIINNKVDEGLKLMKRAKAQIEETDRSGNSVFSHVELSKIHFEILTQAHAPLYLKQIEARLTNILLLLQTEMYPYALADCLVSLVQCQILHRGLSSSSRRFELADQLLLAMLINPYSQNLLNQIARTMLFEGVFPCFTERERQQYGNTITERVLEGNKPFEYLRRWGLSRPYSDSIINLVAKMK